MRQRALSSRVMGIVVLSSMCPLGGCTEYNPHVPREPYAPPLQFASQVVGTYADHSPSEFGGSLWKMLTGDEAEEPSSSVIAQTRVENADDHTLRIVRMINGVPTTWRCVPYRVRDGYLRISQNRFWTVLLFSYLKRDESAVTVEPGGSLRVWRDWAPVYFIAVVPIPGDPGPPPYWHEFRRAGARYRRGREASAFTERIALCARFIRKNDSRSSRRTRRGGVVPEVRR